MNKVSNDFCVEVSNIKYCIELTSKSSNVLYWKSLKLLIDKFRGVEIEDNENDILIKFPFYSLSRILRPRTLSRFTQCKIDYVILSLRTSNLKLNENCLTIFV